MGHVKRPLWASTSTKDPSYPDTLYVDTLIGPNTVNTLPDGTLLAFDDHGTVARTVDADVAAAHAVVASLLELGIDLEDVAADLEAAGVASFADAFVDVLARSTAPLAPSGWGSVLGVSAPRPKNSYGEETVDRAISQLLTSIGDEQNGDLVRKVIVTALEMDDENVDRLELKIASQTMAEMLNAWRVFSPISSVQR
ncbi:MAG: transaldolase family protein [Acidimicrobiales bacterium]